MQQKTQRDQQVAKTTPIKREKQFKRFLVALKWLYRLWLWANWLLGLFDGGDS